MVTVMSVPINDISTILCDINCSELLRLHITGHGTVVIYSLYRDNLLSSVFDSLNTLRKKDAVHTNASVSCFTIADDTFSYNMMVQTTRPIGLRPSALLKGLCPRTQHREIFVNGYSPPCPCKVLVTPSGLQINTINQTKVLCIVYNVIETITLDDGICRVSTVSSSDGKGYNVILYGLSPFVTEFVYILLRAYSYLIQTTLLADEYNMNQNILFHAEECVAEKAALCSSIQNLENNSFSSYTKSSQIELTTNEDQQESIQQNQSKSLASPTNDSLQAFAHIEDTFGVEHIDECMGSETLSNQLPRPHTPTKLLSTIKQLYVTAPQKIHRVGDNQGLSKVSKSKIQDLGYFYEHLNGIYVPASISILQPTDKSILSISITTSEAIYTIAVSRAFQGFDSAARFIRSYSSQSLRNTSEVLDAARAEYLRSLTTYSSLEPIVLLSETHSLGIIPVLLSLKEAQIICLQSSMRLVSTSIPALHIKI